MPLEKLTGWLLGTRANVPAPIALQLMNGLFTTVPIFIGGVINTALVAAIAAFLQPSAPFIGWLVFEVALGTVRLGVLIHGQRLIARERTPPRLLAAILSCTWSASVGYGACISLLSGDWLLSTIVCMSAAAMVCGICLRNFGTPRLAAAMVFLTLAPIAVGGLFAAEPILAVISFQLPIYIFTIFAAAFSLHRMLVSWMTALSDLKRSESFNETILQSSPDYTIILDAEDRVIFCNQPNSAIDCSIVGEKWLPLLPEEDRPAGALMLERVKAGETVNLVTHDIDPSGQFRWFDVIANGIADASHRIIMVARDITHQKKSEEHALWMAQHDTLTGLPNRAVLQDRLDIVLANVDQASVGVLLILDVDNFKAINDTLGHDAGDALLSVFADRLRAALDSGDLVARTGGDEFAVILNKCSEEHLAGVVDRIFTQLSEPLAHEGRLLQCAASIGASFIPRDGRTRSEIMKAADIALYAAKAGGRGQCKVFEPAMMVEVERHQMMIASARNALQRDAIVPYYQPKVSLRTSCIVGFEALLRWRDLDDVLRGPDVLKAALEDPTLGGMLSDRMIEKVLNDVQCWLATGVEFGHVAINVAAVDFRGSCFADTLLARLAERRVPTSCIQIEVTETVFLGHGADEVEVALKRLSAAGVRIALDDFGTGYASLSHLNQFPVDLLKIDKSFVQEIGTNADSSAISSAVINLGHCLGLEVIAEGVETHAQERHLAEIGCDTAQGFLYSHALSAQEVPGIIQLREDAARIARKA